MAPLAKHGVQPRFDFTDYIGREIRGGELQKSYIAIFCCFVTEVVHLKVVTNLATHAFLVALRGFTGRPAFAPVHTVRTEQTLMMFIMRRNTKQHVLGIWSTRNHTRLLGHWHQVLFYTSESSRFQWTLGNVVATWFTSKKLETLIVKIQAILNSRLLESTISDLIWLF